jgi:hypothetical protein
MRTDGAILSTPMELGIVRIVGDVLRDRLGTPRANHAATNALEAAESMGPLAASLGPLVKPYLDDPYQWSRIRAARALWRMGQPVSEMLPTLIAEHRCRPVGILAAELLAEIGPAAVDSLPRLREIRSAEGPLSEGGFMDERIEQEEAFRSAVANAIDSIERK